MDQILMAKTRRLRSQDGVFFTGRGYDKLAYFVEQYIRRDLREAQEERDISLAGHKLDQKILLRQYTLQMNKAEIRKIICANGLCHQLI